MDFNIFIFGFVVFISLFSPFDLEAACISNFHYIRGGAWKVIQFGKESQIRKNRETSLVWDLFLFGSIFIMGLYHLGLFLLRKKDRTPLFFSLFCFTIALRILLTGESYFPYLFPEFDWEFLIRLNRLCVFLALPLICMFIRSLFSKEFSRKVFVVV